MAINIAIDGPSASGKSSVSEKVAELLGYTHLNTGAMYRVCALYALEHNIDFSDDKKLLEMFDYIKFEQTKDNRILLNDKDVTEQIATGQISMLASDISTHKVVREQLVKLQKEIAKDKGYILDGRDIGTVVLPDAEVKIYMTASVDERAKRRYLELKNKGIQSNLLTLRQEIIDRDYQDTHRKITPLRKACDAIEIDTTDLSREQVINIVYDLACKAMR